MGYQVLKQQNSTTLYCSLGMALGEWLDVAFQGVYGIDTLPDRHSLLVCNTDKSAKPGQH